MALPFVEKPEIVTPAIHQEDPRLGHWLAKYEIGSDTRVAIVGFSSDEGVRRNGGRIGAAEGPRALREALYRLTPDAKSPKGFIDLLEDTVDVGDIQPSGNNMEENQERLGECVSALLEQEIIPIILGGGHETTYGHFLGYVKAKKKVEVLNWDAHADVRPLIDGKGHSGSPFRQAIEHSSGLCRRYSVAALHPWSVSAAHADWIREHDGRVVWLDDLTTPKAEELVAETRISALATFDLDALDAAAMPGVSAPGVGGMSTRFWLQIAECCGRSSAFTSFDVVELNPLYDPDGRSAKLAALTVWCVLKGLARREDGRT